MDFFDQLQELNKPTVHKKEWMNSVEMILATKDHLNQIAEECISAGHYGLDLETTGLDQRAFPDSTGRLVTNDKIVGYCIAPSTTKGYYIPVRHREEGAEANVPPRLVVEMVRKINEAGAVAVFHNAKFDQKFLMHEPAGETGEWDNPKGWEDTLIMAYVRDSRQKRKGLKFLAKDELDREMIELDELFLQEKGKPVNKDFSTLDPTWEPVVWYAAADAINTLALYHKMRPAVIDKDAHGFSSATIYTVEKLCLTATIWMEQCRIHIDRPKLIELIKKGQKEWWDCISTVYEEVSEVLERDIRPPWVSVMSKDFDPSVLSPDYMEVRSISMRNASPERRAPVKKSVPSLTDPKLRETVEFLPSYDITIPDQFGLMLRELGVRGLKVTDKSGQIMTRKDEIERVLADSGDQFPWMRNVKRFREVAKALSNVLFNLYHDTAEGKSPDGCVWANFNGHKVDTGRFSTPTPSSSDFHGQVNWNVQSTKAFYYTPNDPPPDCVYRQREVISARPGHTLFAVDYSGVELRIVTNLSGEPKWMREFFRCSQCDHKFERGKLPPPFCPECGSDKIGDLHSATATDVLGANPNGDPKEFKMRRQTAKIVNFLLCYGGSGNAVNRSTGCGEDEGWRIKNNFDKTYEGLLKWWRGQEKQAQKQEYVRTAFGRKYSVPDINSPENRWRSKAKRNAVNGPVQGSSADIMKLAMGLLYRDFKKRGWLDKVLMTITIHDELVFEIRNEIMGEAVPVIEHIMCRETVKNLDWTVPLKVDVEFGPNWTVPMNLTEMAWNQGGGDWTPELASRLPSYYQNYLECGGTPVGSTEPFEKESSLKDVGGEGTEIRTPDRVSLTPPAEKQETNPSVEFVRPKLDGTNHIYVFPRARMSPESAERLARVLHRCRGRGMDLLIIRDEDGNDLLGEPIMLAWEEFRVCLSYERLA